MEKSNTGLTTKGELKKEYQAPCGVAPVERHVYQGSRGDRAYWPLDRNSRIGISSSSKFAGMARHEYAEFGSARVIEGLTEEDWEYAPSSTTRS